mgnify:CR=1 FL=1
MKCENCGKNEVTFIYQSNINGQVTEKHLCSECAEKLGLTRQALADRLGVSVSAVGNYETGISAPKEEVLLRLFDALRLKTQLAAPTGRAAKRLSEVTGREASTIHRLLEAQFDEATGMMSFYHDEEEPLNIDAMLSLIHI